MCCWVLLSCFTETVNECAVAQGQEKETRKHNYTEPRFQLIHLIKSIVASTSVHRNISGLLELAEL